MATFSDKKKEYPKKQITATKILTDEVLAAFARRDEQNKAFRLQFESACLNVFGTASPSSQDNLFLMVDNSCHEQLLFKWTTDCGLIVQAFLG